MTTTMESTGPYDISIKLSIAGDGSSGKTCLLKRFMDPDDYFDHSTRPTLAVEVLSKIVMIPKMTMDTEHEETGDHDGSSNDNSGGNVLRIKTIIWDNASQVRFRHNTISLTKQADAVLLCLDLDDLKRLIEQGSSCFVSSQYGDDDGDVVDVNDDDDIDDGENESENGDFGGENVSSELNGSFVNKKSSSQESTDLDTNTNTNNTYSEDIRTPLSPSLSMLSSGVLTRLERKRLRHFFAVLRKNWLSEILSDDKVKMVAVVGTKMDLIELVKNSGSGGDQIPTPTSTSSDFSAPNYCGPIPATTAVSVMSKYLEYLDILCAEAYPNVCFSFTETSAKLNLNVTELFHSIIVRSLERKEAEMSQPTPDAMRSDTMDSLLHSNSLNDLLSSDTVELEDLLCDEIMFKEEGFFTRWSKRQCKLQRTKYADPPRICLTVTDQSSKKKELKFDLSFATYAEHKKSSGLKVTTKCRCRKVFYITDEKPLVVNKWKTNFKSNGLKESVPDEKSSSLIGISTSDEVVGALM